MRRLIAAAALCVASAAAQDLLTGGYGNERTNADLAETVLTPANVKPGRFGKLFTLSVDGQIYAQPLYQRNVAIRGKGAHNVVFVVTMHNSVYAFDSDTPGTPLWTANLGPAVDTNGYASDIGEYSDILPENGILSTPVIDPVTNTIYAVAATLEKGTYLYRLHALDTASGAERPASPALIGAQVPGMGDSSGNGSVSFVASQHIQRPALLLSRGTVYVSFGSHGDGWPFHGWVMAYSAANVQKQTAVFNASPNGAGGAFWQSGRGLAADPAGDVYGVSSNGDTDGTSNFSDSVLKLDGSNLSVKDWFAPADFQILNDSDDDLGSCGAVLIPGTNMLVTGGKEGIVYLLDKSFLGHTDATDGQVLQSFKAGDFGIFNMALWARPDGARLYLHPANSNVSVWQMSGGRFSGAPIAQSMTGFNIPYQGMTISANGYQPGTGILWVLASGGYPLPAPGTLHAYDAESMMEIWNSGIDAADVLGQYVKFVNPTVADGKVFVPSLGNQLVVYGPKTGVSKLPSVTAIVNAADYTGGAVSPGEIVALFGDNLGPKDLVLGSIDGYGNMSRELFGMQVLMNNVPAPLIYTSAGAAAAIVPYEVAGADSVSVQVMFNGTNAQTQTIPLAPTSPALFTADASGRGPGAILNRDYSLNTADNPADQGSIVVLYGTGGGMTTPAATTGTITAEAQRFGCEVSVTVGGQPAQVLYAGNAGGEVAGAMQLNIRLPQGVTGTAAVVVTVSGRSTQSNVTVAIR